MKVLPQLILLLALLCPAITSFSQNISLDSPVPSGTPTTTELGKAYSKRKRASLAQMRAYARRQALMKVSRRNFHLSLLGVNAAILGKNAFLNYQQAIWRKHNAPEILKGVELDPTQKAQTDAIIEQATKEHFDFHEYNSEGLAQFLDEFHQLPTLDKIAWEPPSRLDDSEKKILNNAKKDYFGNLDLGSYNYIEKYLKTKGQKVSRIVRGDIVEIIRNIIKNQIIKDHLQNRISDLKAKENPSILTTNFLKNTQNHLPRVEIKLTQLITQLEHKHDINLSQILETFEPELQAYYPRLLDRYQKVQVELSRKVDKWIAGQSPAYGLTDAGVLKSHTKCYLAMNKSYDDQVLAIEKNFLNFVHSHDDLKLQDLKLMEQIVLTYAIHRHAKNHPDLAQVFDTHRQLLEEEYIVQSLIYDNSSLFFVQ